MLLTTGYGQRQANFIPIPRDLACSFVRVGYSLLPQAVIADELAVDPGLADPQVGLGLEFIFNGGERHVAGIKQHQRLLDAAHQLTHFADVAFEHRTLQHASDVVITIESVLSGVSIHAQIDHRGSGSGYPLGEQIDGIVIAEEDNAGFEFKVVPPGKLGLGGQLLGGEALGIEVEKMQLMTSGESGIEPQAVTDHPGMRGMVTLDDQDLCRIQRGGLT